MCNRLKNSDFTSDRLLFIKYYFVRLTSMVGVRHLDQADFLTESVPRRAATYLSALTSDIRRRNTFTLPALLVPRGFTTCPPDIHGAGPGCITEVCLSLSHSMPFRVVLQSLAICLVLVQHLKQIEFLCFSLVKMFSSKFLINSLTVGEVCYV